MSDEEFHREIRALYKAQGPLLDKDHGNDYHWQVKLPGCLHARLFSLAKQKGWNRATALKYAVYKLLYSTES